MIRGTGALFRCGLWAALSLAWAVTGWGGADDLPRLAWTPRSDWINVREHGVTGDGQTDDTAALQAVLGRVGNGVVVYFPPGIYRITAMLTMTGPAQGTALIGHGRDTVLRWDGPEGGAMLREDGFSQNARYEGLVLDGGGRADIGFWHVSNTRFESEVLHRNMAFIGFRRTGLHMELNYRKQGDKYATAEVVIQNCLFEECGTGFWSGSFNDYNYTYEGCEFRRCGTGIHCVKGNFYLRNTHFEGSRDVDVDEAAEHGCSLRRVTSHGSRAFLRHFGSVAPVVLQDVHVGGWVSTNRSGPAAVVLKGGPVLMFDCSFTASPDGLPPVDPGSPVVAANCVVNDGSTVFGQWRGEHPAERALAARSLQQVRALPLPARPVRLTPETRFLRSAWAVPGRIFDAKLDFGAKGDGRSDDTEALQKTIEAARQAGHGAMAYFPQGRYVITRPLHMEGADYSVGGCGPFSRLLWRGEAGGTMMTVNNPQGLTLENLMIGHYDAGRGTQAMDILQTEDRPSRMTYEAVHVFGLYQKSPFERGMHFRRLAAGSTLVLDRVEGNLHFADCARATVFAPVSYEGSLVVEGREPVRDGFMGFQTRMATVVAGGLYLRDNQSLVASDFYMEQSDSGYHLSGDAVLPAGRVTIQAPKLHLNEKLGQPPAVIAVDHYRGEVALGPMQFPCWPRAMGIEVTGTNTTALTLVASKFYESLPDWRLPPTVRIGQLGNIGAGPYDRISVSTNPVQRINPASALHDDVRPEELAAMGRGLEDLRRLGEIDLAIHYPAWGGESGRR